MAQDICVPVGDGYVNVRVGAIIEKDGKILMVTNESVDYYYSVGGRIHLGESAGDAVRREVLEETGCALEIDRLGFIHEDFFIGDSMAKQGFVIRWGGEEFLIAFANASAVTAAVKAGEILQTIGFYFYMKTPADFAPHAENLEAEGRGEHLEWVSLDTEKTVFPAFFRTELAKPVQTVRHIVTDERN